MIDDAARIPPTSSEQQGSLFESFKPRGRPPGGPSCAGAAELRQPLDATGGSGDESSEELALARHDETPNFAWNVVCEIERSTVVLAS